MDRRRALGFAAALGLVFFLCVFPSLAARAGGDEAARVVAELQKRYGEITSVEAAFTQEAYSMGLDTTETSKGRVWFKKPGRMRWVYTEPAGDELVSDGETFWLYQEDLAQVVVRPADEVTSSVATDFLSGVGDLEEDFHVTLAEEDEDAWRLELAPREPLANIERLFLGVDKETRFVVSTTSVDFFGNTTTVRFDSIKINGAVADDFFSFVPPEGVTVLRQ